MASPFDNNKIANVGKLVTEALGLIRDIRAGRGFVETEVAYDSITGGSRKKYRLKFDKPE